MPRACPGELARLAGWPNPAGLALGLLAALAAQAAVVVYHHRRLRGGRRAPQRLQRTPRPYAFAEGVRTHFANVGGLGVVAAYLAAAWMLDAMPCSYYRLGGGVRWWMVAAQIVCQDGLMYLAHRFEHRGPLRGHAPHHRFTNPRLFDAFDGSAADTAVMVVVPLAATARLLHATAWEYMLFGAGWSAWLCLIHSEAAHPWDGAFRRLGLGTAADHHVHHLTRAHNYGHTMMWWDRLAGTYRRPEDVAALGAA